MERFEINKDSGLELFSSFVSGTKEKLNALADIIKENIKKYETNIESAEVQIAETVSSREKCENEIAKMEVKIDTIKDAIENVESTYKKIVEAYSSTSKGETKEIYSDIIDGAKANCEKDVEKNRSDIARLNSDIEAINNNIQEFNRLIDELDKNLEGYKQELDKYKKAEEYLDKANSEIICNLEEIGDNKPKVKTATKKQVAVKEPKIEVKKKEEVIEEKEPKKEPIEITKLKEDPVMFNEELQRIYDLTGYKKEEPKVEHIEEKKVEEPKVEFEEIKEQTSKIEPEPIYTNNLENLFAVPSEDVKIEPVKEDYNDTDMFEWEKILNGTDTMYEGKAVEFRMPIEEKTATVETPTDIIINPNDNANQLLAPYGTTIERLQSLVNDTIIYKDGTTKPFEITNEDVIKAINAIDGNDLRKMKTVGPETTIIKIVKKLKEGK